MSKKIVTVEVTRYYSKTGTVEVEVDTALVGDELVEFLTHDVLMDIRYEDAIGDASLVGDDTTYEWQDPTDSNGGTL
jgi:hypothetical protein